MYNDDVHVEDHMYPPENSKYIFMGCGSSTKFNIGIIGTPSEIFDKQPYPCCSYISEAKSVKNFYVYHSSWTDNYDKTEVLGFTDIKEIKLQQCDAYDYTDDNSLTNNKAMCVWTQQTPILHRCGTIDYDKKFGLAFYYK